MSNSLLQSNHRYVLSRGSTIGRRQSANRCLISRLLDTGQRYTFSAVIYETVSINLFDSGIRKYRESMFQRISRTSAMTALPTHRMNARQVPLLTSFFRHFGCPAGYPISVLLSSLFQKDESPGNSRFQFLKVIKS